MLLGKRPRPVKRTTSMTEFTVDIGSEVPPSDADGPIHVPELFEGARYPAIASPRNHRRFSGNFIETAHFLQCCTLCKRRLGPGRDIYMYRGDSAFCSLECRQQQMNIDERKEKCALSSMKNEAPSSAAEASSNGETVAAA
ncbi:hypothetical protein AMTRI_Chr04g188760 [Amborella trichopoda]|uniref:FLZ-type domain-containing protein n=1 Tax=Amborella trichopoda TaxID=13333 RepID=W1NFJ7_AMBTC|nr:uncharacterized protein LOC18421995 [Amborella trichopoda]ERM94218.1 hypothetical protein AMTR_s00010p00202670 [Amborella trichopoda]|eukprot:XP_006826981.1 uncharacterized protein LOC18421995 [Amborella trichopoda]